MTGEISLSLFDIERLVYTISINSSFSSSSISGKAQMDRRPYGSLPAAGHYVLIDQAKMIGPRSIGMLEDGRAGCNCSLSK